MSWTSCQLLCSAVATDALRTPRPGALRPSSGRPEHGRGAPIRELYRHGPRRGPPDECADPDIYDEAFDRERGETEVSRERPVNPFSSRPVVPELPCETADQTRKKQVDQPAIAALPHVAEDRLGSSHRVQRIEQKREAQE